MACSFEISLGRKLWDKFSTTKVSKNKQKKYTHLVAQNHQMKNILTRLKKREHPFISHLKLGKAHILFVLVSYRTAYMKRACVKIPLKVLIVELNLSSTAAIVRDEP